MSNKPVIVAIALLGVLSACHARGGGGGQTSPVTYGNTNPITRQQEHSGGAVPLRAGPPPSTNPNQGIVQTHTQVISRGGQVLLHVDANKATASQLQQVPGIGETTAAQIVANRPYKNAQDLSRKTGIPQGEVNAFAPYLKF
ncbi:MAG TPA: helix-hairpin-helix domain-containing protein [Oscillatoriaceae cyanobacterium]